MKKRKLKKSEKSEVLSVIANVNRETLYASIVSKISGMVHIAKIDERRQLWEHCIAGEHFRQMCDHFLCQYIKLYRDCNKGADKYAVFYLTYHDQVHTPSSTISDYISMVRQEITATASESVTVTDDTWMTLISTMLHTSFNEIQKIISHHIELIDAVPPSTSHMGSSEEEDVALLRLGGWALFSCIQYRKQALKGKTKTKHTQNKLLAYKAELLVFEALVDDDKVNLPCAITAQDCGFMTFPCERS